MNSSFERELERALSRMEPPDGFARRVMERLPSHRSHHRYWFGALAAGVALALTFGGIEQNRHEQRLRAQETQRQMVFALTLTAQKLDHVNVRLQRSAPELSIGPEERGR